MKKLTLALLMSSPLAAGAFEDFERSLSGGADQFAPALAAGRAANAAGPAEDARCRPETADDVKLYSSAFRWGYTLAELKALYETIYVSDARLPQRAYWNAAAGRYELPLRSEWGGTVPLPESFVRAVARHVSNALAAGYIDAVFLPDMGHSHFYIPEAHWKKVYEEIPVDRFSELYAALFKDPYLLVLYHTAEQLTMREQDGSLVADPRTRFRYETRNIVGVNSAEGGLTVHVNRAHQMNTVEAIEGHHQWGSGFNISANARGCFAFEHEGKTIRFDLSLYDLEPSPAALNVERSRKSDLFR